MNTTLFHIWRSISAAPYHFPVTESQWASSMYQDVDSDGRTLFSELFSESTGHGLIQYGTTAFGFGESGEMSNTVHHKVIRMLYFDPAYPEEGEQLLAKAMAHWGNSQRIYAFFHYFGMSVCARHGKLHESQGHIHDLLLQNGFTVEHENVYYARELSGMDVEAEQITIDWKKINGGNCREFAASLDGQEFGWGQVHFLPQGHIAYLRWIYIDEKRQHQGLGTAAMATLCAQLHKMGITRFDTDTALQNTAAQGYYEKTGFTNLGITRSYFATKE